MAELWHVRPDDQRAQWALVPHVSVGPLRFGMSPGEAEAAIGGRPTSTSGSKGGIGNQQYWEQGLNLYYRPGDHEPKLFGITVNARRGPQVRFDGRALVAQVPSELEDWIGKRAEQMPIYTEMFYLPRGECGSFSLGLVVCVQRAGDRLVTRPVFLPAEADDDMYHQLPPEAWQI